MTSLLFVPGWCGSRASFSALERLAQRPTLAIELPGHGGAPLPAEDFGSERIVADALAAIGATERVVPVTQAHAGFVAIELRRRLGERIPGIVFLDWIMTEAPPPFLAATAALQTDAWQATRDALFARWKGPSPSPVVARYVDETMGAFDGAMWRRAGREITAGFAREKSPLHALEKDPVPTLHLYGVPDDPAYLAFQQRYAAEHPWFEVRQLATKASFPMLSAPEEVSAVIERFVTRL